MFGFTITWNPPNVSQSFITGYKVHIDKVSSSSGRRRRQGNSPFPVTSSITEFEFRNGDPFTDYLVRVDADLNVNGAVDTVAALARTTLRTAEGSEPALSVACTHGHAPSLLPVHMDTPSLCCIACTHVLVVIAVQNTSDLLYLYTCIYICSPVL